jgi:hypothetical protein
MQVSQMLNAMKFIYNYEGAGGETWRDNPEHEDIEDTDSTKYDMDQDDDVEANELGESQKKLPKGPWSAISKSQNRQHKRRS